MFRAIPVGEKWGKEFISWDTCPMHLPGIQATLPGLGRALAEHAPAWTERSLFGVWIGTPHLVLVAKEPPPTALRDANWSVLLTEPLREVGFHLTNQVGKTVFGEGPIESIYRKPARTLTMAGKDSVPPLPICAFRQIALTLVDRARGEAVAELLEPKPALVLDLYCGTGEIARRLPPETGWIGVEASAEAATYAGKIRADGRIAHAAFVGFVEHRLRDSRVRERIGDDYAIYVNPPRPGLGDAGRELLLDLVRERRPKSIVYLSCSASSLARDLGALESVGARVESLRPFDFFPQTEHFETLAVLKI